MAVVEKLDERLVHPMLTVEQATLVHQALITFLNQPEESISDDPDEEQRVRGATSELVYFFSEIVDHPERWGLRSKEDTKRVLRAATPPKGEAQPPRNKRKRTQARRQSFKKRNRSRNRAEAEDYNRARQIMEDEQKEADEAFAETLRKKVVRFEELAAKETLTNEEVQELLEEFGAPPEALARIRELRSGATPQARIDRAAASAESGGA